MREFKFRVWDKLNGMIYFDFDDLYYKQVTINHGVYDMPVMQWTGLKDSNDKEMYEGDVVSCESSRDSGYENRVICYDIHQAKYKTVPLPAYHINSGRGGWTGYELRYHNEVIGNIYENPELINS